MFHHYSKRLMNQLKMSNVYDDWLSFDRVDKYHLNEENVRICLDLFVNSDYGQNMFGCHDHLQSYGITGELSFVEIVGPDVYLKMKGKFWHRRATVLGQAAVWLNACIPEITSVSVVDKEELNDFEEIIDDDTGDVLYTRDKRAPDFNGDRETMEYQGIDPDLRGPFAPGVGGFRP